ncbi:MAG: hypothetical protein ACLQDY_16635 [Streptosporangiaceae bacterium]
MTPVADLAGYVAIPAVTGLTLAPDGSWLAVEVKTLDADQKKYLTGITGCRSARPCASTGS